MIQLPPIQIPNASLKQNAFESFNHQQQFQANGMIEHESPSSSSTSRFIIGDAGGIDNRAFSKKQQHHRSFLEKEGCDDDDGNEPIEHIDGEAIEMDKDKTETDFTQQQSLEQAQQQQQSNENENEGRKLSTPQTALSSSSAQSIIGPSSSQGYFMGADGNFYLAPPALPLTSGNPNYRGNDAYQYYPPGVPSMKYTMQHYPDITGNPLFAANDTPMLRNQSVPRKYTKRKHANVNQNAMCPEQQSQIQTGTNTDMRNGYHGFGQSIHPQQQQVKRPAGRPKGSYGKSKKQQLQQQQQQQQQQMLQQHQPLLTMHESYGEFGLENANNLTSENNSESSPTMDATITPSPTDNGECTPALLKVNDIELLHEKTLVENVMGNDDPNATKRKQSTKKEEKLRSKYSKKQQQQQQQQQLQQMQQQQQQMQHMQQLQHMQYYPYPPGAVFYHPSQNITSPHNMLTNTIPNSYGHGMPPQTPPLPLHHSMNVIPQPPQPTPPFFHPQQQHHHNGRQLLHHHQQSNNIATSAPSEILSQQQQQQQQLMMMYPPPQTIMPLATPSSPFLSRVSSKEVGKREKKRRANDEEEDDDDKRVVDHCSLPKKAMEEDEIIMHVMENHNSHDDYECNSDDDDNGTGVMTSIPKGKKSLKKQKSDDDGIEKSKKKSLSKKSLGVKTNATTNHKRQQQQQRNSTNHEKYLRKKQQFANNSLIDNDGATTSSVDIENNQHLHDFTEYGGDGEVRENKNENENENEKKQFRHGIIDFDVNDIFCNSDNSMSDDSDRENDESYATMGSKQYSSTKKGVEKQLQLQHQQQLQEVHVMDKDLIMASPAIRIWFHSRKGKTLRYIFEAINAVMTEVNLVFRNDGLYIFAITSSCVVQMRLFLAKEWFEGYVVKLPEGQSEIQIGTQVKELFTLLKFCDDTSSVQFMDRYEYDTVVWFIDSHGVGRRVRSDTIKLQLQEVIYMQPSCRILRTIRVAIQEFQTLLKHAPQANQIGIYSDAKKLVFTAQIQNARFQYCLMDSTTPEKFSTDTTTTTTLQNVQNVQSTFGTDFNDTQQQQQQQQQQQETTFEMCQSQVPPKNGSIQIFNNPGLEEISYSQWFLPHLLKSVLQSQHLNKYVILQIPEGDMPISIIYDLAIPSTNTILSLSPSPTTTTAFLTPILSKEELVVHEDNLTNPTNPEFIPEENSNIPTIQDIGGAENEDEHMYDGDTFIISRVNVPIDLDFLPQVQEKLPKEECVQQCGNDQSQQQQGHDLSFDSYGQKMSSVNLSQICLSVTSIRDESALGPVYQEEDLSDLYRPQQQQQEHQQSMQTPKSSISTPATRHSSKQHNAYSQIKKVKNHHKRKHPKKQHHLKKRIPSLPISNDLGSTPTSCSSLFTSPTNEANNHVNNNSPSIALEEESCIAVNNTIPIESDIQNDNHEEPMPISLDDL